MEGVFVPWLGRMRNSMAGYIIDGSGCHIWLGARKKGATGYGMVGVGKRTCLVHRVRYELEVGPIPKGMHLDHYVCDNGPGGCCNPLHCRPVTQRENNLRSDSVSARHAAKTHCIRGHALTGDNLCQGANVRRGERACRACAKIRKRRHLQRERPASTGFQGVRQSHTR